MLGLRGTLLCRLLAEYSRDASGALRAYSMYPPTYIKPVYQKEKLEELIESGEAKEREFTPVRAAYNSHTSSVFHDSLVRKFTNHVMKTGQKALSRELVEQTFREIKLIQLRKWNQSQTPEEKSVIECDPNKIFHKAVENCRPLLIVSPIRRGGVTYQVPMPVTEHRSYFESMRWLVKAGKEKERTIHFPQQMARELLSAARNEGRAVKMKQDLHQLCEANKAYAHYRWG
ncbi:hypothetical protein Pmani_025894 [Petrolisthes manimaculis]|uniref:Small ribosomal subunit protein uS7 domain-containing protein n=1 Tax=Petrolisthes manimaculis TaxID=1843537 RepID=A0AAE1P6Y3_9EUCA|nr:hypothetical protein Pmani_025894 [Petrolisthes manimaculis]